MSGPTRVPRSSVDVRTRHRGQEPPVDPVGFWEDDWTRALEAHGERAVADAEFLGVGPLTIRIDHRGWTLGVRQGRLEVTAARPAARQVDLDQAAFTDLVLERKTAFGLAMAGRVAGDEQSVQLFCAWDAILRSVLAGRYVYRPGEVVLRDPNGRPLDLNQEFKLGEATDEAAAAHFLAETGFLLLRDVFSEAELAPVDADLTAAVEASRPDDGVSWWATTREGVRYPCRILDFVTKSTQLQALLRDDRFLSIGQVLDDGHVPGDPFGEHFSEVTAEGLVKRVDSVEGLACLPWHKDCERGGHAMFCAGLTVGLCLTPIDEAHGGLDVIAGSHRALIPRTLVDAGLDLPAVTLSADRGDVTVHASCVQHRSTHPRSAERRVVYTGFALPPRQGDRQEPVERSALARERAQIADGPRYAAFPAAMPGSGQPL